jgi:hypothetical protein
MRRVLETLDRYRRSLLTWASNVQQEGASRETSKLDAKDAPLPPPVNICKRGTTSIRENPKRRLPLDIDTTDVAHLKRMCHWYSAQHVRDVAPEGMELPT